MVAILSIRGTDAFGNGGVVTYHLPDGLTIAQYQAFVTSHVPSLDDITGLKLNEASVTLALTMPAVKATAVASSLSTAGANMSFDAAGTAYSHSIRIPAIRDELVSGKEINASVPVGVGPTTAAQWAADVITGETPALPSDRYDNKLEAFQGGSFSSRKL